MNYITVKQIIQINEAITGVKVDASRVAKVNSVFASIDYYDTVQEQIACIVSSIIKNHYFIDGNKRTALFVYLILCVGNDIQITYTSQQLAMIIVDIAMHKFDVEYSVSLLF